MNTKIGFTIAVLLLTFIGVFMYKHRSPKPLSLPKVLGTTDQRKLTDQTKAIGQNLLDTSLKLVETQASQTAQLISTTLINAAMDPIIQHIDKLPPAQKEQVVQAICK